MMVKYYAMIALPSIMKGTNMETVLLRFLFRLIAGLVGTSSHYSFEAIVISHNVRGILFLFC